jgi:hypothetical protein
VTTLASATARSATGPRHAGTIVTLGGRVRRAVARRAGRFRVALFVFVLLLPLLVTSLLGGDQ